MRNLRSEDGFTLVELMMATAITLVLLGTALSTFRNALQLNETAMLISDSNQNLRAGTNLLVRDLMQVGRGIPTGGIPIPSGVSATALNRPAPPDMTLLFDNTTQTTLPAITTGFELGPVVNGKATDIVTMLALDPTAYVEFPAGSFNPLPLNSAGAVPTGVTLPVPTLADDGASLMVGQFSSWLTDTVNPIKQGDLLLFNNANGFAVQTVTGVDTGTGTVLFAAGDPFNFNQRGATQGSIIQIRGGAAFPRTDVVRIQMLTYFVDTSTTGDDDSPPRLARRLNFEEKQQALAGVVEDLVLTYDLVDNTNQQTKVPSLPATIDGIPYSANQIRKANLHVGVRSELRSTVQGGYMRQYATTVVSLRGLAYVDRYQ